MTLGSYGRHGTDAYDLVDRLPPGAARAAAWNAYVCQTYADKLAASCAAQDDAARVCRALYDLARTWLERAHEGGPAGRLELPAWGSPFRSRGELVAMRETLDALRTYIAFAIGEADPRLGPIDRRIAAADGLWIERPPPELRGGIGDALVRGINDSVELGAAVALG